MGHWLRRAALAILLGFALLLLSIVAFRFVKPPITTVMLADKLRGMTLHRQWVPLEHISPNLPLAVIASEDGRFCVHWGVDWGAMREAIKDGGVRGASTIPMQVAKNLYLWNGRSYIRKALELPLAYVMSLIWPKQRMMEVYLNIAQFGPGIYGAEEASRYYFRKSASELTRHEARSARRHAAQSAAAQSAEAELAHASDRAGGRAPHADHRQALRLRAFPALTKRGNGSGQPKTLPL